MCRAGIRRAASSPTHQHGGQRRAAPLLCRRGWNGIRIRGDTMVEAAVHVKRDERPAGAVAYVTVDNQRRLNCLSTPLIVALADAFAKLGEEEVLRAVVLTGAGERAFIGGADLRELGALEPKSAREFITRLHQACRAIRE